MHYDLIIVGGGIGGGSLASVMARAGRNVLLLEKSDIYEDHVRGEWIAPWGVAETKTLGLYDLLRGAGGHHVTHHVTYDPGHDAKTAEQTALPLAILPGIEGPLCIGHPHHCQTLFDEAGRAGATCRRPALIDSVTLGDRPSVSYRWDGQAFNDTADLIVGADGRQSMLREQAGITLHQNKPHHWFGGLLVEEAWDWNDKYQAIGTEGDFGFLAFPQGGGKVRVYGGYPLDQRGRFKGDGAARHFLDSFKMDCAPANDALIAGKPAGPLFSYFNNDSWTDQPFAPGLVLVGDAAGWNDPINGLGLSITYRDVRMVTDILKATPVGTAADFGPYGEERAERMRRLRFAGELQAALDMEFGEAAQKRRESYNKRRMQDPLLGLHSLAILAGPETVPEEAFTEAKRKQVLEGA